MSRVGTNRGGVQAEIRPRPGIAADGDGKRALAAGVKTRPDRSLTAPALPEPAVHPAAAAPQEQSLTGLLAAGAWLVLGGIYVYLAYLPVPIEAQGWFAVAVVLTLLCTRKLKLGPIPRTAFLLLATHLTLRYFFWRSLNTLSFHGPVSFAFAIALYLAEIYGITVYLLGVFVNINPLDRQPAALPENEADWPSVDVLVPSYNEDAELLETTLLAATQIDYPADKLHVYLLDDGGTVQKRNDADPAKSKEARERHFELQALCREVGAIYLTREKNNHAKAGNINAALEQIDGELCLILDADHVPTVDILKLTTGWFVRDPKLFLVQTPHFFINPDPIEKNLGVFQKMPSENEMFYGVIQKGLDFWGSSFFCGSAALIRRRCLDEIGGISGITITEDAETALDLHARGYHSAYLAMPMISGLQPETFTGFVVQRVRWAQGMVQIFLLKNPLLKKGLTLQQKLCYLSSSFFWFFSYARVTFMIAPAALLIFGLRVYDANLAQFAAYALPHLLGAIVLSHALYGNVRWTLASELYELMQALFSLSGVVKVLLKPRAPTFIVTPKGEHLAKEFISPLSRPFYALMAICLLAFVGGGVRLALGSGDRDAILITLVWNLFNFLLLLGSLGALHEKRQVRKTPRVLSQQPAELLFGKQETPCTLEDISVGGAGLSIPPGQNPPLAGQRGLIRITVPALGKTTLLPAIVRYRGDQRDGSIRLGVEFQARMLTEKRVIIGLVHGSNEPWQRLLDTRGGGVGITRGAGFLIRTGLRQATSHARAGLRQGSHALSELMRRVKQKTLSLFRLRSGRDPLDEKA